ncbi:hypothetical protein F4815DRAFT_4815 [Daldinia loculata]|nr:hypothetical protein F4815DRAFT_4815 [Daldinia loculata]
MKFHDRHFVRLLFFDDILHYLHRYVITYPGYLAFYLCIRAIDLRSVEYRIHKSVFCCCCLLLHLSAWNLGIALFDFYLLFSSVYDFFFSSYLPTFYPILLINDTCPSSSTSIPINAMAITII